MEVPSPREIVPTAMERPVSSVPLADEAPSEGSRSGGGISLERKLLYQRNFPKFRLLDRDPRSSRCQSHVGRSKFRTKCVLTVPSWILIGNCIVA